MHLHLTGLHFFQEIKKDQKKYHKLFEQKDRMMQYRASKVRGLCDRFIIFWSWGEKKCKQLIGHQVRVGGIIIDHEE